MSTELERTEERAETLLGQLRNVELELAGSKASRMSGAQRKKIIRRKDEILAEYRPVRAAIKRLRFERCSRPGGAAGQLSEAINQLAALRDAMEAFDVLLDENRKLEQELEETKDYARELQAKLDAIGERE